MITQAPSREIVLNFQISKIKNDIGQLCRLSEFMLKEKNDLFGTFKIAIVKNFRVGMMNVSLNQVDENRTNCKFEIFNAVGGYASPSSLSDLLDYFLRTFAQLLEGKIVIKSK